MLYLSDRLTLVLRCVGCGREQDSGEHSSNFAYWHAEDIGWLLTQVGLMSDANVMCPDCTMKTGDGGLVPKEWHVWCETCEDEDGFLTEAEAKTWKKKHTCDFWDRWPDVQIEGPEQRLKAANRRQQYEKERAARQALVDRQNAEQNRLVGLGMVVDTARKSWWKRWLLRMAGV